MFDNSYRPRANSLLPPVIKWMLILNVLFFAATALLQEMLGIDITDYLGLHYISSTLFMPHQFVTYAFMHGGLAHIFSNMFALWMIGAMLENTWGSKRFFIYYMVCAIGAAFTQMAFGFYDFHNINHHLEIYSKHPNPVDMRIFIDRYLNFVNNIPSVSNGFMSFLSDFKLNANDAGYQQQSIDLLNQVIEFKANIPTVGASGAVFGILLAFGMMFPDMNIYLYFLFPIKAKYFVFLYGAFEFWAAFENDPNDNVAHLAHLGGMLFGFILIRIWNRKRFG